MAVLQIGNLSPEALAELENSFTNLDGATYFAAGNADMRKVATSGARLSRSPGNLRQTFADEFLGAQGKEEEFVDRVLHGYGDDSIAQLYCMCAVTEGISNLATKKVEFPRLMSYLEQSTRYRRFDQKDEHGRYPFHTPAELTPEDARHYDAVMTVVFDQYSSALQRTIDYLTSTIPKDPSDSLAVYNNSIRSQACDIARVLLPTAVQASVATVGSAQAFENQIYTLLSDTIEEPRAIGADLLREARKVAPEYFRRVDRPDRGGNLLAHRAEVRQRMKEWAKDIGAGYTGEPDNGESVELVGYTPIDELDIAKYALFDASDLSLDALENLLRHRSDQERANILRDYAGNRMGNRRHKPGRAFEHPRYEWEIRSDYGNFRDLQRHRMVDDLRWQNLTTKHGRVNTPPVVEAAGVTVEFNNAYEALEALNQFIGDRYGEEVAQYATALGHIMRWTITMNAREAFHFLELRTGEKGHPGYRAIANRMYDQLEAVHPVIASTMTEVDRRTQGEITLSRLEEERRNAQRQGL